MLQSLDDKILASIKRKKNGTILFAADFAHLGESKSVNKAFERLNKSGKLIRLSKGIYCKPEFDKELGLGIIYPSLEKIAEAIAKRDRCKIAPTGDFALNQLGLSTQIPMNAVFYTDGSPRRIKIYNGRGILFQRVAPKRLAFASKFASLLTFALKTLGKDNISEQRLGRIRELLSATPKKNIIADYPLMPGWIRTLINKTYDEISGTDRLAKVQSV